jgi:3-deoxy-D-manno-octulosonic-acid transferase
MLHQARQLGVPMLLLHGRISDRSIGGYRRIRLGTRWMLRHFDRIMAQSGRDADRLVELGAAPDCVSVAGNAKYDGAPAALAAEGVLQLREQLHLGNGPVWVAGSTRQPEEERLVLEAFAAARRSVPNLILVLAPRHVTRVPAVLAMARAGGIDAATVGERTTAPCRVVDTMGLLARLYAVGAVAFVGNSLVSPGGGQNLIEPLAQGVPVLVGPFTWEFRDASHLALQSGVAWQVRDVAELADHVTRFAAAPADPELRARAIALVAAQRGAAARYAMAIDEALTGGARVAA